MESSRDRRDFQIEQARRLGIEVDFFRAITRADFSAERYQALCETWERPMIEAEVGCFLSHRALWDEVASSGEPSCILEDDALLSKHFLAILTLLENESGLERVNLESRLKKKTIAKKGQFLGERHSLRRLYIDRSGSTGYVLWPAGARKLLARFHASAAIADKAVREFSLASYQLEPAAVVASDFTQHFEITSAMDSATTINIARKMPQASSLLSGARCKLRRVADQLKVVFQQGKALFAGEKRLIAVERDHFVD